MSCVVNYIDGILVVVLVGNLVVKWSKRIIIVRFCILFGVSFNFRLFNWEKIILLWKYMCKC